MSFFTVTFRQIVAGVRASEVSDQPALEIPPRASLPTITEVKSLDSELLSKKRSLKLEILNRMIDDFHLKHGRRDNRTGRIIPIKTVHGEGDRDRAGGTREPQAKDMTRFADGAIFDKMVEGGENNNVATLFPAIAGFSSTSPPLDHIPTTSSPSPRPRIDNKAFEKGGKNLVPPGALICICCGCEGGKGHGRRCTHKYRRCGFCRVEEVHRVLSTAHTKRKNRVPAARKVRLDKSIRCTRGMQRKNSRPACGSCRAVHRGSFPFKHASTDFTQTMSYTSLLSSRSHTYNSFT